MADDPKKKKLDGKRISKQPWEQAYQRRKKERLEKQTETQAADATKTDGKQARKTRRPSIDLQSSSSTLPDRRRLALAVSTMGNTIERGAVQGNEPIDFCEEWKEKGKAIFNMVLFLFSFSPKTTATIKRIMSGIDGVCEVPYEVLEY